MKRALITGMTGMVGSHLADYLFEQTDWDIYGMQRWRSPLVNIMHLMPRINGKDRVFVEYGDLNDMSSLLAVVKKSEARLYLPLGSSELSSNELYRAD